MMLQGVLFGKNYVYIFFEQGLNFYLYIFLCEQKKRTKGLLVPLVLFFGNRFTDVNYSEKEFFMCRYLCTRLL